MFVAGDEGLDVKQISDVLEIDKQDALNVLREMQREYKKAGRGLQIVEVAQAFQFTTLPEHAPYFERLAYSPVNTTLSQSALETLAIVAYKQPITRAEVDDIRGVKSERSIQTLHKKRLIEPVGRSEKVGRPILYATTREFLDYFGLGSLDDLPDLPDFYSSDDVEREADFLLDRLHDYRQFNDDDEEKPDTEEAKEGDLFSEHTEDIKE